MYEGTMYDKIINDPRWLNEKRRFYNTDTVLCMEGGGIIFSKRIFEAKKVEYGEWLSYDNYLDLQYYSIGRIHSALFGIFADCSSADALGKIEAIDTVNKRIYFSKLWVRQLDPSPWSGYEEFEEHIWIDQQGLEEFEVGDCIMFEAAVTRYLRNADSDPRNYAIDFKLNSFRVVDTVNEDFLPTDDMLLVPTKTERILNTMKKIAGIYNRDEGLGTWMFRKVDDYSLPVMSNEEFKIIEQEYSL